MMHCCTRKYQYENKGNETIQILEVIIKEIETEMQIFATKFNDLPPPPLTFPSKESG